MVRDTAAHLTANLGEESFFATAPGRKLNCFLVPGTQRCQQLNCYRGPDDMMFREHLRMMKKVINECRPEKDVPTIEEEKEAAAGHMATSSVGALGVAVAAVAGAPFAGRAVRPAGRTRQSRCTGSAFL
eukprot:SRR837773.19200.p1 GENE.SRR837773.19200~~SRR837773.19200.p1  ORF type:complete len:129 (+),score=18.12 SRR837773.19200:225-611(+)